MILVITNAVQRGVAVNNNNNNKPYIGWWSNQFVKHFIYKISSFYYCFLECLLIGLNCKIITELILFS